MIDDVVYAWAMLMTVIAVCAVLVVRWTIKGDAGRIQPQEQMRERTPWPPPPLTQDTGWVSVHYDRPPRREPLALPRGD